MLYRVYQDARPIREQEVPIDESFTFRLASTSPIEVVITDQSQEIVVLTLRPVIYTRIEHFTQIFTTLDIDADGVLNAVEWDAFLTEELRSLGFGRAQIYNQKYLGLFTDIFM
jgi:hypothetical protein